MIYKRYRLFGSALCMSLALLATSCSMSDDMECPPDPAGGGTGKAYIQLSFRMADAQGTRLDPDGGENGDGNEAGQDYENRVSKAVAFLFDGNVSVNGPADTDVIPVYFSKVNTDPQGPDTHYVTATQQADVKNGKYKVIVVANPGDDQWWNTPGLKLGPLRDKILKTAWRENNGTYSDFLMASADEPTRILVIENNPEDDPATTTVSVERMAARVDYRAKNSYPCTDPTYTGATVEITGATIVNRLTAGSYLLKRVADDVDGTNLKYLGYELPLGVDAGVQTNYVLDPWTALKTQANLTGTPFTVEEQPAAASDLYDSKTYIPTRSDNPEDWADYCKAGVDATEDDYLRVGYALENTTGKLETSLNYNTGIVFKAQFHPQGVDDYSVGNTFFTYNGTIYPSLTSMMGQLNMQADFATYAKDEIAKLTTWDGLKGFANSLNDPTGYGDYLTGYADEHLSETFTPTANELTWTYYLDNKLGVVEDAEKGPEINLNGVETRAKLYESSNELLRTYYKGQCYYIWWLRHSNDGNDDTNGVMEYAVVRNNIYKVYVESIYSLGGDIPDNEQIKARVYVNKWTMLTKEELPM